MNVDHDDYDHAGVYSLFCECEGTGDMNIET